MAESTIWWIAAGVAVAVELLTGTFYLLMLGLGLAAAAVTAHLGAGTVTQLLVAAVIGGGAVVGWRVRQGRRPAPPAAGADPDVNMDVGEIVHVDGWHPDGTATVQYRGANWTVLHKGSHVPSIGSHRIAEVVGSRLLVEKI